MALKVWSQNDTLTASDLNGNFALALRFLGDWSSATAYLVNDVVVFSGTVYRCKATNTNSSPDSHPANWAVWTATGSGGSVPDGGTTGQVLGKLSNTNGDADWIDPPSAGPTGPAGADGVNGSVWYSGTGVPANTLGADTDFYLRSNGDVYRKASGAFAIVANIKGTTGATGASGLNGTNGNTLLSGTGAPSSGTGQDGDFYINLSNFSIYGPKTSGAWGSGTSLIGANGAPGAPGANGADGIFSAIASQAEAEAGSNNTKGMTPLRVAQAIAALAPSGGGSGGSGSIILSYELASDTLNGASVAADTWVDACSNQTFTKASGSSKLLVSVNGGGGVIGSTMTDYSVSSRIVIDSGGTPVNKTVGGFYSPSGGILNPFSGSAPFVVDGLAAGTHTIKVQVISGKAGTAYMQASSYPNYYFLRVTIQEF